MTMPLRSDIKKGGLILSRNGEDHGCSQTLRDVWTIDHKLILVLTDDDVRKMLLEKSSQRDPTK